MKRSIKILTLCCAFVLLCLMMTACGHEHAYGEWVTVKAPTCTETGMQERTCECGQKETGVLSAIGHKAGADATCTDACKCTVCGEVLKSENGHVPGTAATCTAAQTCVVCGAEVTPAKGHSFGDWTTVKEPTCTEDGSKERVCECGEKETETVAAKGHTPGAAATCTEKQICTVCNAELVAALGHSGEWVVVKEATKTEDGLREKTCATCGFKEREVLYATGSLGLKYGIFVGYDGYRVMGIGTCTDTEIVIPSVYKGKPVTSICDYAFDDCTSLTSIEIPDSVTSIGDRAFEYCVGLTSVTIPDSVTSIGDDAFGGCYKLVEIINKSKFDIPKGSSDYGYIYALEVHDGESKIVNQDGYLFYTYKGINYLLGYSGNETELVLPENYEGETYEIYRYAFYNCDNLISVTIGSGVTSIGYLSFYDCINLVSVTIGSGVTSIGEHAFEYCLKLVEVINKSNLKFSEAPYDYGDVDYYALEIHGGESKIVNQDDYLFYTYDGVNYLLGYCGDETELVLPENYNGEAYEIYQYAFYKCSSLTSITIPDGVTSIGESAFENCRSLTSVMIEEGVTDIVYEAFYGCTELTSITFNGTTAEWKAISKGSNWKYGVPATEVVCSDGEVYI